MKTRKQPGNGSALFLIMFIMCFAISCVHIYRHAWLAAAAGVIMGWMSYCTYMILTAMKERK